MRSDGSSLHSRHSRATTCLIGLAAIIAALALGMPIAVKYGFGLLGGLFIGAGLAGSSAAVVPFASVASVLDRLLFLPAEMAESVDRVVR